MVRRWLIQDNKISNKTQISPYHICILLSLCLTLTCFQISKSFYTETWLLQGSPVSTIVANIYTKEVEIRVLTSLPGTDPAMGSGMWTTLTDWKPLLTTVTPRPSHQLHSWKSGVHLHPQDEGHSSEESNIHVWQKRKIVWKRSKRSIFVKLEKTSLIRRKSVWHQFLSTYWGSL